MESWSHRAVRPLRGQGEEGDAIVLETSPARSFPYLSVVLDKTYPFTHLLIEMEAKAGGLEFGAAPWQRPALVVLSFDQALEPVSHWPKKVLSID